MALQLLSGPMLRWWDPKRLRSTWSTTARPRMRCCSSGITKAKVATSSSPTGFSSQKMSVWIHFERLSNDLQLPRTRSSRTAMLPACSCRPSLTCRVESELRSSSGYGGRYPYIHSPIIQPAGSQMTANAQRLDALCCREDSGVLAADRECRGLGLYRESADEPCAAPRSRMIQQHLWRPRCPALRTA